MIVSGPGLALCASIDIVNSGPRNGGPGDITALEYHIPVITTLSGASAAVMGIRALQTEGWNIRPLQEYHRDADKS